MINREFVDAVAMIMPWFKKWFKRDVVVAVTDREKFVDILLLGDVMDFKLEEGAPLPDYDPAWEAMREKRYVENMIPKEWAGFAFHGNYIPIVEPDGEVSGCLVIIAGMDTEDAVKKMAGNLDASLGEVAQAINEIATAATDMRDSEKQMEQTIRSVSDFAQNINDVLSLIKAISDQTKMLGLNAAIEAARAGEIGRGFGVVAEEIHKLSDESKQTAAKIESLTRNIEASVRDAVKQVEHSTEISQTQASATEQMSASIEELSAMAVELKRIADQL